MPCMKCKNVPKVFIAIQIILENVSINKFIYNNYEISPVFKHW